MTLFTNQCHDLYDARYDDDYECTYVELLSGFGAQNQPEEGTMQVSAMTAFITYAMMIVMCLPDADDDLSCCRAPVAAGRIDEVIRTELSIQDAKTPEN